MLSVRQVTKEFGGIRAVDACSFEVERASITGLIGPNGAGKTTLFNIISGFLRPDRGEVWFDGQRDRPASRPIASPALGWSGPFKSPGSLKP